MRVCRVEQQHATVSGAEARCQSPVLTLDVVDNATAWPCQQGRHHQADALAGPGGREAQHVFGAIMAKVVPLKATEYDTVRRGETSGTDLR
jgi:hypothetical protein